jgi:hypothetical protein
VTGVQTCALPIFIDRQHPANLRQTLVSSERLLNLEKRSFTVIVSLQYLPFYLKFFYFR